MFKKKMSANNDIYFKFIKMPSITDPIWEEYNYAFYIDQVNNVLNENDGISTFYDILNAPGSEEFVPETLEQVLRQLEDTGSIQAILPNVTESFMQDDHDDEDDLPELVPSFPNWR